MRRFVKLVPLFLALVLIFGVAYMPRSAAAPPGSAVTKVYNLYATDGYYQLPDGQPLYMYGFIGGLDGQPFVYQQSCIPSKKDKITGLASCMQRGNLPGTAVQPMGGPIAAGEMAFAGNAQFPAPIIHATTNDVVEIRLKNLGVSANPAAPNDPHSIHLHGLDVDAANDGVPETSLGAVPANLCADGTTAPPGGVCAAGPAPGAGNVIVYMFTTDHPGTYMYHCHQEADIHVQMGMFGALVIYDPNDPTALNGPGMNIPGQSGGTLYGMQYDKDYVLLLSEFDPRGHADEAGTYAPNSWDPKPYNWALYRPQYWSINGLSFPQTIHADIGMTAAGVPYTFGDWVAAHPGYDPLITGSVGATGSPAQGRWGPGDKVLIRVINMGFETHPMHMHGYHGKVIGSDARGWDWANGLPFNQGMEKNTLVIGSGETYDWLVDFGQQSFANAIYDVQTNDQSGMPTSGANTQSRYYDGIVGGPCEGDILAAGLPVPPANTPVRNTFLNCPVIPDAGDLLLPPYIGGPPVTGLVGHPDPTSQFFPFHNHDDYKATNNGVYPGGMFTFLVPTP